MSAPEHEAGAAIVGKDVGRGIEIVGHTFLFQPGEWKAEGTFVSRRGRPSPAFGRTMIVHRDTAWVSEGFMLIRSDEGEDEIRNSYWIRPFTESEGFTTWRSENPALGSLEGSFSVVGDTILSIYRSEDGSVTGTESLRRVRRDRYQVRGALVGRIGRLSSWAVTLTRAE